MEGNKVVTRRFMQDDTGVLVEVVLDPAGIYARVTVGNLIFSARPPFDADSLQLVGLVLPGGETIPFGDQISVVDSILAEG